MVTETEPEGSTPSATVELARGSRQHSPVPQRSSSSGLFQSAMRTVESIFDEYAGLLESKVAPGTWRGYMVGWRKRVRPSFGDVDVASINTLAVEVAFASWSGSVSTRKDALAMLSAICRVAVKGGIISTNPCNGVERVRTQHSDPTSRALDDVETRRLFSLLPPEGPYRRFVLALLFTGCRLGEVAGLRVSDVDLAQGVIKIQRSASAGLHGELSVGPTKGRRVRTVPMPEQLLASILEGAAGKGPHDLLFPGPRGGTINSKNLSRAIGWSRWRNEVKEFAPGEPPLKFHDLRHTAATTLFHAGVSAVDVQAILGHASLQVTQMYANTRADAARRGTAALSSYYASRQGQTEADRELAKSA